MGQNIKSIINKVLIEGYYRQNYYHYTDLNNLHSIIKTNELKEGNIRGISLTRDKFLHKHTDYLPTTVRLELNGDLITQDFKVKSFMDNILQTKDGEKINNNWKGNPNIDNYFLEFEERVMTSKIEPLNKYLLSIDASVYILNELKDDVNFVNYIKEYDINFGSLK